MDRVTFLITCMASLTIAYCLGNVLFVVARAWYANPMLVITSTTMGSARDIFVEKLERSNGRYGSQFSFIDSSELQHHLRGVGNRRLAEQHSGEVRSYH
jgi:hypothetical protein